MGTSPAVPDSARLMTSIQGKQRIRLHAKDLISHLRSAGTLQPEPRLTLNALVPEKQSLIGFVFQLQTGEACQPRHHRRHLRNRGEGPSLLLCEPSNPSSGSFCHDLVEGPESLKMRLEKERLCGRSLCCMTSFFGAETATSRAVVGSCIFTEEATTHPRPATCVPSSSILNWHKTLFSPPETQLCQPLMISDVMSVTASFGHVMGLSSLKNCQVTTSAKLLGEAAPLSCVERCSCGARQEWGAVFFQAFPVV